MSNSNGKLAQRSNGDFTDEADLSGGRVRLLFGLLCVLSISGVVGDKGNVFVAAFLWGGDSLVFILIGVLKPYFLSYPPVATFLTWTTLTPTSLAIAALLGDALLKSFFIEKKISLFIEIVFLLPDEVVLDSFSLNEELAKGLRDCIKQLVLLKLVFS